MPTKERLKKMRKSYRKEIRVRDKQIQQLQQQLADLQKQIKVDAVYNNTTQKLLSDFEEQNRELQQQLEQLQQTQEGWIEWWLEIGSGITPLPGADMEEHACRVSEKAFKAGQVSKTDE